MLLRIIIFLSCFTVSVIFAQTPIQIYANGVESYNRGNYPEAKKLFQDAIAQKGIWHEASLMIGLCEFGSGHLKEAGKVFRELRKAFPVSDVYFHSARLFEVKGNWRKAARNFLLSTDSISEDNKGLLQAAEVYRKHGKNAKAIENYQRYLRNAIDHRGLAMIGLAQALESAGELVQAEMYYRIAMEQNPENPLGYFRLGKIEFEQGKQLLAMRDLAYAYHLDSTNRDVYYPLAKVSVQMNSPRTAITLIEQNTGVEVRNSLEWSILGEAYQMMGESVTAANAWYRSIELDSKNSSAWAGLARLAESIGDISTSKKFQKKAERYEKRTDQKIVRK